jgi:hypothetical protein
VNALVTCRYYATDKTAYTHFVAVPAARQARRHGVQTWIERHWLNGPFVAVALSGPAPSVVRAANEVRDALMAGLVGRQSVREVVVEELLANSERLGALEAVPGPYLPIYPDNTVQILTPDRSVLAELLGGQEARECRDRLLAAGLDCVGLATGRLLDGTVTPLAFTVTALALHASTYAPGPTGGAMSFLSHVEDYLHRQAAGSPTTAGAEPQRAVFERAWTGTPKAFIGAVERLLAGDTAGPVEEALRGWSQFAVETAGVAYAAGHLPLLPPARADGESLSDFHRYVSGRFDPVAVADHFGPYRFATNVLYQLVLTCGVRPVERYLGAYLISRAVTQLTGVDWVARARADGLVSNPPERRPTDTAR